MSLEYDARAVIDELMRLLDDRYKSGFPVLKEMLQTQMTPARNVS